MTNKERVTILDVAEAAKVSKMSVWRALNGRPGVSEKTRQHILQTMRDLGYDTPNHDSEAEGVIALIFGDIETQYSVEILRGITQAAQRLSADLMLYSQHENNRSTTAKFLNEAVDGVILITPWEHDSLVTTLKSREIPYLFVDHYQYLADELCIFSTNRKGALDAMRHLLALGHQRIGYISGQIEHYISQERLQGYKDALREVGLPYQEDLLREGDYADVDSGRIHALELLDTDDPPSAIFAANDLLAMGAMQAVQEKGLRVGVDVSVVGFDDIALASVVYPKLTTVHQPIGQMGERAVDLLLMRIKEQPIPPSLLDQLPTELIIRDSTARK